MEGAQTTGDGGGAGRIGKGGVGILLEPYHTFSTSLTSAFSCILLFPSLVFLFYRNAVTGIGARFQSIQNRTVTRSVILVNIVNSLIIEYEYIGRQNVFISFGNSLYIKYCDSAFIFIALIF